MLTKTLDEFPQNVVFMDKDMRKDKLHKDEKDAVVVAYETVVDEETIEGSLIVPGRLEKDLR